MTLTFSLETVIIEVLQIQATNSLVVQSTSYTSSLLNK